MSEHGLRMVAQFVRTNGHADQTWCCNDCDLRISFSIAPAEQADDFVRVVAEAHLEQIAEAADRA